jgi:hypothetical protein
LESIKDDKRYTIPADFMDRLYDARDYYLHAPVKNPAYLITDWLEPEYDVLYDYLVNHKKLSSNVVSAKIYELKLMYKYYLTNGKQLITLNQIKQILPYYNNYASGNKPASSINKPAPYYKKPRVINYKPYKIYER